MVYSYDAEARTTAKLTDEGVGLEDDDSTSTSIQSAVFDYVYENNRRYHRYREGAYLLPNDNIEQNRLKLCHLIWSMLLNGHLSKAPVKAPLKVLDVGCGTGDWAIEFGDCFPSAVVIGTDLSPIQPTWIPPNVHFYVDDAEDVWTFDKGFDLIHGRMLAGSIKDWTKFFRQAYAQLRPGGYIEMNEFDSMLFSDDAVPSEVQSLKKITARFNKASKTFGKPFGDVAVMRQAMHDAGFVDIKEEVYKIPIGDWPADPVLKNLGQTALNAAQDSVEPYMLALGTRILGESADTIRGIAQVVKNEISNPALHLYAQAHFIWGRKPGL